MKPEEVKEEGWYYILEEDEFCKITWEAPVSYSWISWEEPSRASYGEPALQCLGCWRREDWPSDLRGPVNTKDL